MTPGPGAALAVLAAAAGLVAAGQWAAGGTPAASAPAGTTEPVASAALVCPVPDGSGDLGARTTATVVAALAGGSPAAGAEPSPAAGAVPSAPAAGTAELRTLPGDGATSATVPGADGSAQVLAYGEPRPPLVASATGALAPGLVADTSRRDPAGGGRGRSSAACAAPAAQTWFAGGGASAGRRTTVFLVNPDDTPAQADVLVHGPAGPVAAPAGRGVVVAPRSRVALRLDAIAPEATHAVVQVVSRAGRVAAGVVDDQMGGLVPRGVDMVPPAAAPARRVVLPGVPAGAGHRELLALAPGEDGGTAQVRLHTPDGDFVPVGLESVGLPAGQVVVLDLADALRGQAGAVELVADVPVVAGLRSRLPGPGSVLDTAFTAGAEELTGPAAVSGLPVHRGTTVQLLLTAVDGPAAARIDVVAHAARVPGAPAAPAPVRVAPRTVAVPAGRTVAVVLAAPEGADWFTAVLTPGGAPGPGAGRLYAGHVVLERAADGPLVTGYPWRSVRTAVQRPATRADVAAAVGAAAGG